MGIDEAKKELINAIAAEIKLSGISKTELSSKTNISRAGIDNILKGKSDPKLDSILTIIDAMGYKLALVDKKNPVFDISIDDELFNNSDIEETETPEVITVKEFKTIMKKRGKLNALEKCLKHMKFIFSEIDRFSYIQHDLYNCKKALEYLMSVFEKSNNNIEVNVLKSINRYIWDISAYVYRLSRLMDILVEEEYKSDPDDYMLVLSKDPNDDSIIDFLRNEIEECIEYKAGKI